MAKAAHSRAARPAPVHRYRENDGIEQMHPGTGAFPSRPREKPAERLRRMESEMLEKAIERHVHGSGQLGSLAVQIIALRAEVAGK